jgi:hypothetical protein
VRQGGVLLQQQLREVPARPVLQLQAEDDGAVVGLCVVVRARGNKGALDAVLVLCMIL